MESIVSNIGALFTGAMSWLGTTATTVSSSDLLLTFVLLPLVGLGVGFFQRLTNR